MSPQVYRLVVNGELGPRYASAFEGMTISTGEGKTQITARSSTSRTCRGYSTGSAASA